MPNMKAIITGHKKKLRIKKGKLSTIKTHAIAKIKTSAY